MAEVMKAIISTICDTLNFIFVDYDSKKQSQLDQYNLLQRCQIIIPLIRKRQHLKEPMSKYSIASQIEFLGEQEKLAAEEKLMDLKTELIGLGHIGDIRDDSRLAGCFALGKLHRFYTVEKVAAEIYKNTKLYETTNYEQISRSVVHMVANDLSKATNTDYGKCAQFVITSLVPNIKNAYQTYLTQPKE